MKVTNKFNLPEPVVAALKHDDYTRGESNRSVTQLIDAPQIRILKKEHKDEITYDASELIWIALGKSVHRMFEDHGVGKWKAEQRLFAQIKNWTISGQVDVQYEQTAEADPQHGQVIYLPGGEVSLYDYKVTSVWSLIFWKASYDQQLNFYAWLARQNKLKVKSLHIVFVFRDWRKADADKKTDYPASPIMVVDVDMWSDEQQDVYVYSRVTLHQDAEFRRLTGQPIPQCTDEERWKSQSKWAVKKPQNKTARRVFDTRPEAEKLIEEEGLAAKGFEIEERPSVPKRCMDWCPVADWCDQWQKERQAL